jgi:hypothetical protein
MKISSISDLPKEEGIYCIRQNGLNIDPFISIGAYGIPGLHIQKHSYPLQGVITRDIEAGIFTIHN